jgi:vacuolar-type H+-ATPase subunit H
MYRPNGRAWTAPDAGCAARRVVNPLDTYERLAEAEREVERLKKEAQGLVDSKVKEAKRQAMEKVEEAKARAARMYIDRLERERTGVERERAAIIERAKESVRDIELGASAKVDKGITALVAGMESVVDGRG